MHRDLTRIAMWITVAMMLLACVGVVTCAFQPDVRHPLHDEWVR